MLLKTGCRWIRSGKNYLPLSDVLHSAWKLEKRLFYSINGNWEKAFSSKLAKDIEKHWQGTLNQQPSCINVDNAAERFYVLSMFPYPSGRLHMGHVRVYTISDVMARFHRLNRKQVIHPMGWDAFGLPAENAARDRGVAPEQWTYSNIKHMKKQLKELGCLFDWKREFATCDPEYYKWTQWIFIKMFEVGLAYQKKGEVNWDPVDETVLAEEQIDDEGRSWRSGAIVEKRYLRQWYLKTTVYAKSLLDGLEQVDPTLWGDVIKLQKHWLGDCAGCRFDFSLQIDGKDIGEHLSVFTPHPEAVYGSTFIAVSPNHWLNQSQYCVNLKDGNSEKDVVLKLCAIHPFTEQRIPIIVSQSIVFEDNDSYLGIGCLSEEDRELARKFEFPVVEVLSYQGEQSFLQESCEFSDMSRPEAAEAITDYARRNGFGGHWVSAKLNDWLISRQRYWGTPIPIIHCPNCKAVPVPESDLPVRLPDISSLPGSTALPLSEANVWKLVTCPRCGSPAERETDTMDTFVDSSWYFLRYLDPHNTERPFQPEAVNKYIPVDLYIGGKEHALLHLYFARFFTHFLYDQGLVAQREPFRDLLTQGMVMGESYQVKSTGRYIPVQQVVCQGNSVTEKATGEPVLVQWEKMSKSKYNGVDPQDVLEEYGSDTTRLCILSNVAPKSDRHWSSEAFTGILNWQRKIWTLMDDYIRHCNCGHETANAADLQRLEEEIYDSRNYHIKETSHHLKTTYLLSVAISKLQSYTKDLKKENYPMSVKVQSALYQQALADFIIMLAPFSPCFASELWAGLTGVPLLSNQHKWSEGVLHQKWPDVDMDYKLPLIIKVNHQVSLKVKIPRRQLEGLSAAGTLELIKEEPVYQDYIKPYQISSLDLHTQPGHSSILNIMRKQKVAPPENKTPPKKSKLTKNKVKTRSS